MHKGPTVKRWTIVIAGFLQHEGTSNGMVGLWGKIRAKYASPDHAVLFRTWNLDASTLAELIWRQRPKGNLTITLIGYSWGAAGCVRLAKQLRNRAIDVENMVLSDPVYRHWYWLGNWRAFVSSIPIKIPSNVRAVTWFRQRTNKPQGHALLPTNANTTIHGGQLFACTHQYMDDLEEFQTASLQIAGSGA